MNEYNDQNNPSTVSENIPVFGKNLAKYSANELIGRVGEEAIKEVVKSVLIGGNIRSLTENLTRKRITLSNAALFLSYIFSLSKIENFSENFSTIISEEINNRSLTEEEKIYLQWMLGLTKKGIQNVLRDNDEERSKYLADLDNAVKDSANQVAGIYGNLIAEINLGEDKFWLNWISLMQIFTAIGSQTLAIRGSEKSMYGKLFEKLILGGLLSILGFNYVNEEETDISENIFWLSSRGNKRESDATLLLEPGKGVRFDIGFIGRGNTEISLDKVSRFEREMEHNSQRHLMTTIVLVDTIGARSRISDMAREINGFIVQMSMSNWVIEVCKILNDEFGFDHELLNFNVEESLEFVQKEINKIDLSNFI